MNLGAKPNLSSGDLPNHSENNRLNLRIMINIFMVKRMEFITWFLKEQDLSNQINVIIKSIAEKFKVDGLPDQEQMKIQIGDLRQEEKIQGDMKIPESIKTSLGQIGEIRNMTPEQKKNFDDMFNDLPFSTTIGELAQKIVAIISGQQKEI